jgi:protein-tyrosine-phosphatase
MKKVPFVCVENSGRNQMAERALSNQRGRDENCNENHETDSSRVFLAFCSLI